MTQQVLTSEWAQNLINVIQDNRPIIYSDGGLTIFSSHGFHTAPTHKYGMALIQGFQDPIGLSANSIEYAYVRYVDSQLIVSTTLPNPSEALLIATVYTDTYKVTKIINHMVKLPDMSSLPFLPVTPPLPTYLKSSICIFIEKPRVKTIIIDTKAPFPYLLQSITTKTLLGSLTYSLIKNGVVISGGNNLVASTTKTTTVFNPAISVAVNDEIGINITLNTLASDVSFTIYAYGLTSTILSNNL